MKDDSATARRSRSMLRKSAFPAVPGSPHLMNPTKPSGTLVDGGFVKLYGAVYVPPRATLSDLQTHDTILKYADEQREIGLGKEGLVPGRLDKALITAGGGMTRFTNGDRRTGGLTAAAAIRSLVFWEGFSR